MKCKRKKYFLGAILNGVSTIIGSALNAKAQRKQAEAQAAAIAEENRQNRITANQQNTSALMQNLNNIYNNNDYLNSYYDRFNNSTNNILRCGGKVKKKKRKAPLGTIIQAAVQDTKEQIAGAGNLVGNIIGGLGAIRNVETLANAKKDYYRPNNVLTSGYSGDLNKNNYNENNYFNSSNNTNNEFKNRFQTLKCGGKRKR